MNNTFVIGIDKDKRFYLKGDNILLTLSWYTNGDEILEVEFTDKNYISVIKGTDTYRESDGIDLSGALEDLEMDKVLINEETKINIKNGVYIYDNI